MEIIFPAVNIELMTPFILITLGGLSALLISIVRNQIKDAISTIVTLLAIILAGIYTATLWDRGDLLLSGHLLVDNFSLFLNIIFLLGALLTVLISYHYGRQEYFRIPEFHSLLLFATLGMMLMASSTHLITIFLGLETLSVSLYVLSGFSIHRIKSLESGLKYFVLGAFASGFLLYGIAFLYGATGDMNLLVISDFLFSPGPKEDAFLLIGLALLLVGVAFKLALVPFHAWAPDVYEGAPTPVTAFMSAGVKAAALAVLIRILAATAVRDITLLVNILSALAVLTMVVGNVLAVTQRNIKRMLAYSSIAHAGYLLVAVLSGGLGTESILFYLAMYTLMNIGAFAVVLVVGGKGEKGIFLEDYADLGTRKPLLACCMAVFMFSLAGIPPTAGFLAKFYIFKSAVSAGYPGLVIIAVLASVVSVYYYIRVVYVMYMKEYTPGEEAAPAPALSISSLVIVALAVTTAGVLFFGIFPNPLFAFLSSISPALY